MTARTIPHPGFPDDDGSADPALQEALAAWERREAGAEPRLLTALAAARLLVPVVAVLGEEEVVAAPAARPGEATAGAGRPLRREKTSEMAVPTLTVPDGRRALPAFTSTDTLARWRADARPVAVRLPQLLRAAAQEGAGTVLIDMAGPVSYPLTGAALHTLADGRAGLPAAEDPMVASALRTVLAEEAEVAAAWLGPGGDTDGTLALSLDPGASGEAVLRRVAGALADHPVLRARLLRGLDLALLPPGAPLAGGALYRRAG